MIQNNPEIQQKKLTKSIPKLQTLHQPSYSHDITHFIIINITPINTKKKKPQTTTITMKKKITVTETQNHM